MIRSEVEELLRLRWNLTGERFSNETVDAWEPELRLLSFRQAAEALRIAAHQTDRVTARAFHGALPPEPVEVTPARRNHRGECLHLDAAIGSSCPDCREYLPPTAVGLSIAMAAREAEREHKIAAALAGDRAAQRLVAYRLTGKLDGWTKALAEELREERTG